MLFNPLAFAAVATALVIIPEVSEHDENIFKALPIHTETVQIPQSALTQTVKVPCHECEESNAELVLDFAIADGKRLVLNDFEVYPDPNPWGGDLKASVLSAGRVQNKRLGYSIAVMPAALSADDHMETISVDVRVIEVDDLFVNDIPTVNVQLIKAPTDEILIASATAPSEKPKCVTFSCRVKQAFGGMMQRVKGLQGCGKKHSNPRPIEHDVPEVFEEPVPDSEWFEDFTLDGPPPGWEDSSRGDWTQLVKSVAAHVFLPVLLGITAGVVVAWYVFRVFVHLSVAGSNVVNSFTMFIGTVFMHIVRLVRGPSRRQAWCADRKARSERSADEEKAALMQAEE